MYMSTRANLDYWSTDNCCLRWSLRSGAITIGFLSLVWQSLMVMSGVMMLVKCPVTTDTNATTTTTNTTTASAANLTLTDDPIILDLMDGAGEVVLVARSLEEEEVIDDDSDKDVRCLTEGGASGDVVSLESNSSISSGNSSIIGDFNSSSSLESNNRTRNFSCPWLPGPETEVLGVYTEEKLVLVAGIFIAYSGVYCILSLCVVVGSLTKSETLLQGWVAFTGFHNLVILASLLVPLPFTTLLHLFLSIAYFILSLYTWAVVKSYMHALKVELNKPLLPEGSITDYTVDGVDVTEIPVQV